MVWELRYQRPLSKVSWFFCPALWKVGGPWALNDVLHQSLIDIALNGLGGQTGELGTQTDSWELRLKVRELRVRPGSSDATVWQVKGVLIKLLSCWIQEG